MNVLIIAIKTSFCNRPLVNVCHERFQLYKLITIPTVHVLNIRTHRYVLFKHDKYSI